MFLSKIFVIFLFHILIFTPDSSADYSEDTCKEASNYLKQTMNSSIKECKNFYKHVCGGFGKSDDDEADVDSSLDLKSRQINNQLDKAIQALVPGQNTTDIQPYGSALQSLYDGCMETQGFPDNILRRLYNSLGERIGYLPIFGGKGDPRPWHVMGTITRETGDLLLVTPVVAQPEGSTNPVLYIGQRSALENGQFDADQTKTLLQALSKVTEKKVGDESLDKLIADLSSFYDDWNNITDIDRTSYELKNSYANLTSSNFYRSGNAGVDWKAYLDGLLPNDTRDKWLADPSKAMIDIIDYTLMNDFNDLINKYSKETVFTYAFLDVLGYVLATNDSSNDLSIAAGTEDRCIQFVKNYAPAASARVYLESMDIDPKSFASEISLIADHIVAAFRFLITSADWMDTEDKVKIIKRVDSITINPGLPNWIDNDEMILENTPKFDPSRSIYENQFEFEKQNWRDTLRQLVDGISDQEADPDFDVNAVYLAKTININLGLSLPPQFKESYPLPVKYGGLGFVIAHELLHAFDKDELAEEQETDDAGGAAANSDKFLKPKASKELDRRRSCVIQQYAKYCNRKVNACVNGETTVNDNIGDVDGLKVAYAAYKFVSQVLGGEPPVPEFVGRTGDQMFFISFARLWCARKNKIAFLQSAGASHSPNKVRVDLSVANFPTFAASFKCAVGTRFAPLKKCSLWGEFSAPVRNQQSDKRR